MLVEDIEYVIFRHPDLEAARRFMLDYGLRDLERHGGAVYMRGYGDAPFAYVATRGEAAFIGLGFRVPDLDALEALSDRFNSKIELSPRPGGGLRVTANDPEGRRLEFVFGAAPAEPLSRAERRDRVGEQLEAPDYRPSHVLRLGRVAVVARHAQELASWYRDKLGLAPGKTHAPVCVLRLNQDDASGDDHTLAIVSGAKPDLDHVSFECPNSSDVGMGQMFMLDGGHRWDIGRRFHSDQIFDYWTDPAGFRLEHYVHGDLVTRDAAVPQHQFGRDVVLV